ncbi:MAG: galactokinase [Planctomycetia bacterium]|nr:galactokinase [Planctomycetia bacterium]
MGLYDSLQDETISEYKQIYGREPEFLIQAPGRVNLIGEHTDYNDGFVFPLAIERCTMIAASRRSGKTGQVWASLFGESAELAVSGPIDPKDSHGWSAYVQGAIACMLEEGVEAPGFDAVIRANVPLGGGLSSSASLEVATATLMEAMSGTTIDPVKKALACQKAEHVFVGMPCGIMDQFISALGRRDHALFLDCRDYSTRHVPLADPNIVVLITNSNVKHELTGSEYPERRASCEKAAALLGVAKLRDVSSDMLQASRDVLLAGGSDLLYRRARHVVEEDTRTQRTADALVNSDWTTAGQLMYASHESMKNDFEISCPEIDALVDIAQSIGLDGGVLGSRMTGGGFGGCTVSLVRLEALDDVISKMTRDYKERTGIEATAFATRAADGAGVLRLP